VHFAVGIQTLATERLHRAGEHLLAQARARSVAEEDGEIAFTRDEWCTWLLESPRLRQWLSRLGNAAVEALSALEDCYLPLLPEGRGELPESTYRLWRKFPLGTHFDHITPEHVRQVFEANASDGQLRLEQFSLCLNQMQIYSTFSIRRLFQLFDHDESGTVELHEFASSFLLLCGGSLEEKLQKAFAMYDADASGYLGRSELNSMLTAFARVGLDAVGCSLSIVASILGEDATVENEVNRRGRAQVERYAAALQASAEQFCYRDAVHLYYSEFIRWARQDRDFLHWLSALRNAWIESLLE
jgi:Ca2+-binding EF-hand superfamily protein